MKDAISPSSSVSGTDRVNEAKQQISVFGCLPCAFDTDLLHAVIGVPHTCRICEEQRQVSEPYRFFQCIPRGTGHIRYDRTIGAGKIIQQ
jgi:hypothetical protein